MEQEPTSVDSKKGKCECGCGRRHRRGGTSEAVYGLGFIGAAIYYLGHAATFWVGVIGILKAIVWPAVFVYNVFGFLNL